MEAHSELISRRNLTISAVPPGKVRNQDSSYNAAKRNTAVIYMYNSALHFTPAIRRFAQSPEGSDNLISINRIVAVVCSHCKYRYLAFEMMPMCTRQGRHRRCRCCHHSIPSPAAGAGSRSCPELKGEGSSQKHQDARTTVVASLTGMCLQGHRVELS